MLARVKGVCAVMLLGWALAGPAAAQMGIIPGGAAEETEPAANADGLAGAIQQAAEAGVSVIVIDSAGNLLSGGPAAGGADPSGHMAAEGSMMKRAQTRFEQFRETLKTRLEILPNSLVEVEYILRETSPDGRIRTYAEVLLWSLGLLLAGRWLSIEIYGKRIARRYVVARIKDDPQGYHEKMPFLVFRFLMGIGGTLFAMVFAYLAGAFLFRNAPENASIQFTVAAVFAAVFLSRTVADLWRMVLSPFLSQYRIPPFSDRDAKRLYIWASALASYDISVAFLSTWVADYGMNYNLYALIYGGLSLIGALGNVLMVLFNARAVSNAIRGGQSPERVSWLLRLVSYAWAPVIVIYIAFGWFRLALDLVLDQPVSIPLVAGTYGVFMSVVVAYGAMNYLLERYFIRARRVRALNAEMSGADEDKPVGVATVRGHPLATYEDLARRVAGILSFVVGTYALIAIWNPQAAWADDLPLDRALDVMVIVFIGYVVFHFFRIWIDTKIAEETEDQTEAELGDEGGASAASRLATLLPLFRGAILAVVVVSIALIALLELGINVSPLFAGAGVVGLAVGFGAQTLVRDIFSGAFFLLDDAFRKGEYIDIGDVKGTVEKISVRSFQLRHHLGALNTIPFGEIKVLTNYSRDWVIMKLPLRVTYDTDVEKVRKLIKKLGQELLSDPVIGENFIQPLKSQGVIEMQDSAMIIRVKFMTMPGDQWLVRKKVYEEIRELFAREGIKFAHREVTVRLADGKSDELTPDQRDAVTGAVQAAIDEDALDDLMEDER